MRPPLRCVLFPIRFLRCRCYEAAAAKGCWTPAASPPLRRKGISRFQSAFATGRVSTSFSGRMHFSV